MRKAAAFTGAKRRAWEAFAKYVKTRDALKTTGGTDYCRCFTCGGVYPLKETDAGHALPGRTEGILFDEKLVYGQCRVCNRQNGGEQQAFRIILSRLYGEDWWEAKLAQRRKPLQRTDADYESIARYYKEETKALLKGETA